MEPEIRFCTSAAGTRIAYATLGEGLRWQRQVGRGTIDGVAPIEQ